MIDDETPAELTLYSLHPDLPLGDDAETSDGERLHGFRVLGKVEMADALKRETLYSALKEELAKPREPHKCFEPRHAVRYVGGDGIVRVILICFACRNACIFIGDGKGKYHPIAATHGAVFNRYLTEAGIAIAPAKH